MRTLVCATCFLLLLGNVAWSSVVYEVWGGNTDYLSQPAWWEYYYSIDKQDYVKLGESSGSTKTFTGSYSYYVVAARSQFLLDCVCTSTGAYPPSLADGHTSDYGNIPGAPDGQYATVGYQDSGGTFRGFVVFQNSGGWTGLTVISDLPPESYVDLAISSTDPTSVVTQTGEDVTITVATRNASDADAIPNNPPAYFDTTLYIANNLQVDWDLLSDADEVGEYSLPSLSIILPKIWTTG